MQIVIRIPGQGSDFEINDISPSDTIEKLKSIIATNHPKNPDSTAQRLISGGKLLENSQTIEEIGLTEDSNIIHLVISEVQKVTNQTPENDLPQTSSEDPVSHESSEPVPENEPIEEVTQEPTEHDSSVPENSWLTPQMKEYFAVWDLSIKCYELSDMHKHLVPRLKLQRALIYANQEKLASGRTGGLLDVGGVNNDADELPRQNVDRENAVVGAQGAVEDDGPQDWLDRFYSFFRLFLLLFIVYNYSSTERFIAVLVIAVTITLYQAGLFRLQRRRRPDAPRPENGQNEGDGQNQGPPERAAPGVFRMIWVFLTRFITSLIPQNPQAVNAN